MLVSAFVKTSILKNTMLKLLKKGYSQSLVSLIDRVHPADLAITFSEMNSSDISLMFDQVSNDRHAAHIISELKNKKIRNSIITGLNSKRVKQVFSYIDSNVAVKILETLPKKESAIITRLMNKNNVDELSKLQRYKQATAGHLMNTLFITVDGNTTTEDIIKKIKKDKKYQKQDYIYLVSKEGSLLGRLQTKDLLLQSSKANSFSELSEVNILTIKHDTKKNEIIRLFKKYRPKEIAVVNDKKQLLGVINYQDFIRIIIDHSPRQFLKNAGSVYVQDLLNDGIWTFFKARIGWLTLCFVSGLFIYSISDMLIQPSSPIINLISLLPTIMLLSLVTSSQSFATLSVFISEYDYKKRSKTKIFLRELKLTLITGTIFGSLFLVYSYLLHKNFIIDSGILNYKDLAFSITAGACIFLSMILSTIYSSLLPIIVSKAGMLPSVVSLPAISTFSSITNSILYLWLSTLLMLRGII